MDVSRTYPDDLDETFDALVAVVRSSHSVKAIDQASRTIRFGTSASGFSWGSNMAAYVLPDDDVSEVRVSAVAKMPVNVTASVTAKKQIERLLDAVELHLANSAASASEDEEYETPEAGWYPDPERTATLRYWNGDDWEDHFAPMTSSASSVSTVEINESLRDEVNAGTLVMGYILAVLLPIVGFVIGITQARKTGHGAAIIVVSIVAAIFWYENIVSNSTPTPTYIEYSEY